MLGLRVAPLTPCLVAHRQAGFAVTGSDDRKLRVWPLDFASHFLEAEHEGRVTALHASPDGALVSFLASFLRNGYKGSRRLVIDVLCLAGLKLLVGTASGSIGMLDVPSVRHVTLVRSHTDIIYGLVMDPHNREFATVRLIS